MKNKLLLSLFVIGLLVGCKSSIGQLPPTAPSPSQVTLTWTAPANCTGCTYVISAATVSTGTTTCPAPNITTPNYTVVVTPLPGISATTLTTTPNANTTVCYIAQTVQNSNISQPSNPTNPLVIGSGVVPPASPANLSGK